MRWTARVCWGAVLVGSAAWSGCGGEGEPAPHSPVEGDAGNGPNPTTPQPTRFSRPTHGSAVDVSEDDTILVTANHDVGTVTVFDIKHDGLAPVLVKKAEVAVGEEPFQVALTPDGDRAFVVLRKEQKLVRIDSLRTTPAKGPEVAVGSEPTAVALTPRATTAWVANWVDGTVMTVDTAAMTVTATIDLNATLAATGVFGAGFAARPALAHPRSIAITNNGDDVEEDESILVTEFFAQQKEALLPNGANADIAKQGFVYRIGAADKQVRAIALPPLADMGILDHNGNAAGCYPNQLQAIQVEGGFAYVLSICASPRGPLGDFTGPARPVCTTDAQCPGAGAGACDTVLGTCRTNCTTNAQCGVVGGVCTNNLCNENLVDAKSLQSPVVTVIDIGGNNVVASVGLNAEFERLFNDRAVPDTTERRMPLHVVDIGFVPGTLTGYLPAHGADAVYRVDFNATYETKAVDSVGSETSSFIGLEPATFDATKKGRLPVGIAIQHRPRLTDGIKRFAYVLNEGTRNVSVLDLSTDAVAKVDNQPVVVQAASLPSNPTDEAWLSGKILFNTGLGRWSFNGQAWGACSTCHWEGLSDQVTWFHRRGARQSPSIDQTINKKNTADIRAMNWQASSDELADNENGALRVVLGGVGAIVRNFDLTMSARIPFDQYGHSGLSGSITAAANPQSPSSLVGEVCVLGDWEEIDVFEKTLRTPRKPTNLDPVKVEAGRQVFVEGKCQGCHGGDKWTLSRVFYQPDPDVAPPTNRNKMLRTMSWTNAVAIAGVPSTILPTTDAPSQVMRYSGTQSSTFDQLTCLIRNVGTFNVAEPGVGVAELRRNMTTVAQGNEAFGRGYNVPSLLGMTVAAPFFHAGNARTLEGLLGASFAAHTGALNAAFLSPADPQAAAKREALVQFLLSIETSTETLPIPVLGPDGGDFCVSP